MSGERFRNGASHTVVFSCRCEGPSERVRSRYIIQMGGGVGAELDFGRAADHVNGDRMLTLINVD